MMNNDKIKKIVSLVCFHEPRAFFVDRFCTFLYKHVYSVWLCNILFMIHDTIITVGDV